MHVSADQATCTPCTHILLRGTRPQYPSPTPTVNTPSGQCSKYGEYAAMCRKYAAKCGEYAARPKCSKCGEYTARSKCGKIRMCCKWYKINYTVVTIIMNL